MLRAPGQDELNWARLNNRALGAVYAHSTLKQRVAVLDLSASAGGSIGTEQVLDRYASRLPAHHAEALFYGALLRLGRVR